MKSYGNDMEEHAEFEWCQCAGATRMVDDILSKREEGDDQGGGESGLCLIISSPWLCIGDMRKMLTIRTRILNSDERLPSSRRCFSVNSI